MLVASQNPEAERRERKFAAEQGAVATTTTKAVAVHDERPAVDRYLDEVAPASIVGRLIKFKKGKFVIADDESEIADSEDFICLADMTMIGWVKFNENAPPDRIMGLLYDGFEMPERETLGDLDQSQWELGLDNRPADPWQHHIYLVLQKPATQEFFTFAASTVTARRSIGNLLRHYNRTLKMGATDYPVIRLKLSGFNHRDERVGWVPTPAFAVVGKAPRHAVGTVPDTSRAADMDDDVPF
jgi:hypothetical protein